MTGPVMGRLRGAFGNAVAAFGVVWREGRFLALGLVALSAATGCLPAILAYVAKLIVDGVVLAVKQPSSARQHHVLWLLGLELAVVVLLIAFQRLLWVCDSLLRARLSQSVLEAMLSRALKLDLQELEQSTVQDELKLLTEHASERPISLVRRALIALQQALTLGGLLLLLTGFSVWLLIPLAIAIAPALWVELRLNKDAFRLTRAHSGEARRQRYIETLLTRSEHGEEIRSYQIGQLLLQRHREIFETWFAKDRALSFKRASAGLALGAVSAVALSSCYLWITWKTMTGATSIGALAMAFLALRQAQSASSDLVAVLSGMHEDQLYLTSLNTFLGRAQPRVEPESIPLDQADGLRFENVSFTYPGARQPALSDINLRIPPGARVSILGKNGSGKTTLLKLLLGLYRPTRGRVTLDGKALSDWDESHLRQRFAVVFQDFGRYQMSAGENIGVGDAATLVTKSSWSPAARAAGVAGMVESLPQGYETQLGLTFDEGRELSTGEWQRLAIARLFVRPIASILVLDEPTASLDAASEDAVLRQLTLATEGRTAILVSHRATWSDSRTILVELEEGRLKRASPSPDRLTDRPD